MPVRCDLIDSPMAKQDEFRFLEALGQNSDVAQFIAPNVEAVESTSITNLYLNKIVAGEVSIEEGLNAAAEELYQLLTKLVKRQENYLICKIYLCSTFIYIGATFILKNYEYKR